MGQLDDIETLEMFIDELGNEIKHVKKASTYLQEIEAQYLLIEKQLEQVKHSTKALEGVQLHFENKTKEFETQLKKNEDRFTELNTTVVSSFSETEQYLKEQIGDIKQDVIGIVKVVSELHLKTNLLEQQVVTMSSNVSTVSSSMLEQQRQINQQEKQILELKEAVLKQTEYQQQSSKKIEKLTIAMGSLILILVILMRFI